MMSTQGAVTHWYPASVADKRPSACRYWRRGSVCKPPRLLENHKGFSRARRSSWSDWSPVSRLKGLLGCSGARGDRFVAPGVLASRFVSRV